MVSSRERQLTIIFTLLEHRVLVWDHLLPRQKPRTPKEIVRERQRRSITAAPYPSTTIVRSVQSAFTPRRQVAVPAVYSAARRLCAAEKEHEKRISTELEAVKLKHNVSFPMPKKQRGLEPRIRHLLGAALQDPSSIRAASPSTVLISHPDPEIMRGQSSQAFTFAATPDDELEFGVDSSYVVDAVTGPEESEGLDRQDSPDPLSIVTQDWSISPPEERSPPSQSRSRSRQSQSISPPKEDSSSSDLDEDILHSGDAHTRVKRKRNPKAETAASREARGGLIDIGVYGTYGGAAMASDLLDVRIELDSLDLGSPLVKHALGLSQRITTELLEYRAAQQSLFDAQTNLTSHSRLAETAQFSRKYKVDGSNEELDQNT